MKGVLQLYGIIKFYLLEVFHNSFWVLHALKCAGPWERQGAVGGPGEEEDEPGEAAGQVRVLHRAGLGGRLVSLRLPLHTSGETRIQGYPPSPGPTL